MLVDLKQNTKEWLEYRKSKFNASQTPDVFGVGFNSPEKLAHIKYGDLEVFQNKAMKEGQNEEDSIRDFVIFQTGINFTPCVMLWDEDERFSASLDGYNNDENVLLEIKYSTNEYEYVKANDKPSQKYYLQVQHQLMVSSAKYALFAVRNKIDDDVLIIKVMPELKTQKDIVKKWNKWEAKFKDKPLEPLENIITDDSDEAVAYKGLVDELNSLDSEIKEKTLRANEIKAELINLANGTKTKAFNVSIYPTTRNTIDYKGFLAKENLQITDEFIKTSTSWSVKVG